MSSLFIGFDTSNYTTSVSVFADGEVLLNYKKLLPVSPGERGLRQSEAVFSHIKNSDEAARSLRKILSEFPGTVRAVGYSAVPRSVEGSYMPCFLAGESFARFVSASFGIEAIPTSHQNGHVMAAVYSACKNSGMDCFDFISSPFISFHVSGGTFEVLLITPCSSGEKLFNVEKIGGTLDVSAGQVIDRIGVKLGFAFPAGSEIDRNALLCPGKSKKDRISVNGLECNLSGLENKADDMIRGGAGTEEVAAYTLDHISRVITQLTVNAVNKFGRIPVIYAGGVMSSTFLKNRLSDLGYFAEPAFSSDNAAGVAIITSQIYNRLFGYQEGSY